MSRLREDIRRALNCACAENPSNTPDFILAEYLTDCLAAYDKALQARTKWYGRPDEPCEAPPSSDDGTNPMHAIGYGRGDD